MDESPAPAKPRASNSKAAAWTLAARQAERLLGIASIAILARVLSPSEFGIVAMAGSVVALVEVLAAFGFDWALMRVRVRTRAHYDTAWTLRVISGFVIFVVLALAAYPAAIYFRQPAVTGIVVAIDVYKRQRQDIHEHQSCAQHGARARCLGIDHGR